MGRINHEQLVSGIKKNRTMQVNDSYDPNKVNSIDNEAEKERKKEKIEKLLFGKQEKINNQYFDWKKINNDEKKEKIKTLLFGEQNIQKKYEGYGKKLAEYSTKAREVSKSIDLTSLFGRAITPEKTEKAWDTGIGSNESLAGSMMRWVGSETGSETLKGLGKGYQEGTKEEMKKRGLEPTGTEGLWEKAVMSAPTSLGGFGVAAAVGLATKSRLAAIASQAIYTGMMEGGSAYQEALDKGANEEQAKTTARLTGVINSFIETAPGLRWASKILPDPVLNLAEKEIKKGVLSIVSKFGIERLKDASVEGSTEMLQELVGNMSAKYTYDPTKDWKENIADSGEVGAFMGLVTGGIASGIGAMQTQQEKQSPQVPQTTPVTPVSSEEFTKQSGEMITGLSKSIEEPGIQETQTNFSQKTYDQTGNINRVKEEEGRIPIPNETSQEVKPVEKEAFKEVIKPKETIKEPIKFDKETPEIVKKQLEDKITVNRDQIQEKYNSDEMANAAYDVVTELEDSKDKPSWVPEDAFSKELIEEVSDIVSDDARIDNYFGSHFNLKNDKLDIEKVRKLVNATLDEMEKRSGVETTAPLREEIIKNQDDIVKYMAAKMEKPLSIASKPKEPKRIVKLKDTTKYLKQETRDLMKFAKEESEVAYKTGYHEARNKISNQFRKKIKDITQIKKDITEYAKDHLPTYKRGSMLTKVANAKTQKDLTKAFTKIDEIATETKKRETKGKIERLVKRTGKAKNISLEYRKKISSLMEAFDLTTRRKDTLNKLKDTKEWLSREVKAGKDVFLPKRIFDSLRILETRGYKNLTVADLEVIYNNIKEIRDSGVTKEKNRQQLSEFRKGNWKNKLVEDTHPIETPEKYEKGIGKPLTTTERIKNIGINFNVLKKKWSLLITPMDVVTDKLDGNAGGTKANSMMKRTLDHKFSNFLQFVWKFKDLLEGLQTKLNLDENNMERIMVYAAREQKHGIEKLMATDKTLTEEKINNWTLSKEEMQYYEATRKIFDQLHPVLAKFMKDTYNQEIGKIKNYTPFMMDWNALDEIEIYDRFHPDINQKDFTVRTKNVKKGMTEERKGGKQKIIMNYGDVTRRYIEGVGYLIHMGEDIKMFSEIINSPEYQAKSGNLGGLIMKEWIELLAKKGGVNGDRQLAWLDTWRKNVGAAVLGFKLSSALIQLTALFDGAALIGNYAFRGANNILKSKEWRVFLNNNFAELRERGADDPAFLELADNKKLAQVQQAGYWILKKLDAIIAYSITAGAYEKYCVEKNIPIDFSKPNQEGIDYATRILRRTQSSSLFKDLPLALSKGALTGNLSLDKAIFQFQSFMLNRWSLIHHDIYELELKKGNYSKGMKAVMFLSLAELSALGLRQFSKGAVNMLTGGEDDEDDQGWLEQVAYQALNNIPFVSNTISIAVYERTAIPSIDAVLATFKDTYTVLKGKKEETKIKAGIRTATDIGKVRGIPGSVQVGDIVEKALFE